MINLFATLRFNIRAFGLRQGLKFPVYIYGNFKLKNIGKINIKCPVSRRMIVIGSNYDMIDTSSTVFNNHGTLDIYGKVFINYGTYISNQGVIVFHGNNIIGNTAEIRISSRLEIGYNTFIGFESRIMDSNMHYVVDVETRQVHRNCSPIILGNYNWLGSNSYIKRGTVTPDYLIVASPNALLSKDYSNIPPYTVMAGCHARPVKQGIRRIYNFHLEKIINKYFEQHPDATFYQIDETADLDSLCTFRF